MKTSTWTHFLYINLSLQPVQREPLIYHLESVSRHSEHHGDLPDEFFEVTVDDVRKRFAQLKSERWGEGSERKRLSDLGQRTACDI